MKLSNIFENEVLAEGIKFTQKEINSVKKKARNIYVGIEFEFNAFPEEMNKIMEGSPPEDIDSPEEQPREELSTDDVYESDEYMEARQEQENEAFEEAFNEKESEKEKEYEELFVDDYEDAMDHLDEMVNQYKRNDIFQQWSSLFNILTAPKNHKNYEFLFEYSTKLQNGDVIMPEDKEKAKAGMYNLHLLYNFLLPTNKGGSGLGALLDDMDIDDVSQLDEDRREFYPYEARSFLALHSTPVMITIQDWVRVLIELPFDDPQMQDLYKSTEGSAPTAGTQGEFEFTELDTIEEKMVGIIQQLNTSSAHNEMKQLQIYLQEFNSYMEAGGSIKNPFYDAQEKYVEMMWEEEKEDFRDEVWENVFNYWEDNVDFLAVIREMQDNANVVVLDSEGEPYVEPDDWEGGSVGKATPDVVKRFVRNYGEMWDIDFDNDFEALVDLEGYGMVEFKSKPKPLPEALKIMHNFNKMIRQIGTTASGTAGMHVNMSLKNSKFTKQNFNALKLISLLDNNLMHELFPVRGHVENLFQNKLTPKMVFAIAGADSRHILDQFALTMGTEKFQGVNMQHMDANIEGARRIEFRYTGGKDYAERGKVLEWTIYRMAYALEAAFDKTFLENQYKKNVIDMLNDETKKYFRNQKIKDFNQLRKLRASNPEVIDVDDFFDKWVRGEIKK